MAGLIADRLPARKGSAGLRPAVGRRASSEAGSHGKNPEKSGTSGCPQPHNMNGLFFQPSVRTLANRLLPQREHKVSLQCL